MDRVELAEVAQSLRSHLEIVQHFLAYPPQDERAMQKEIISRCNSIEAKNAQLRAGVMARPETVYLPDVIRDAFGTSGSEARRLIAQGAVRVDGDVVTDLDVPTPNGARLTVGTRRHHVIGSREPFTDDLRGERDR